MSGEFVLLKNIQYNNDEAKYFVDNYIDWCWLVKSDDEAEFLEEYADVEFKKIDIKFPMYAFNWNELNYFICGKSSKHPQIDKINCYEDLSRYSLIKTRRYNFLFGDFMTTYFESKYAIAFKRMCKFCGSDDIAICSYDDWETDEITEYVVCRFCGKDEEIKHKLGDIASRCRVSI